MTIPFKILHFTSSAQFRIFAISVSTKRFYRAPTLAMNSATSAFQTSFGAEGNLGIAPKQMSQIQNLKLNDENEIPMVKFPIPRVMPRGL
jgi:hypothetical protein